MPIHPATRRFFKPLFPAILVLVLCHGAFGAGAKPRRVFDLRQLAAKQAATSPPAATKVPEIPYTAARIAAILGRAKATLRAYGKIRRSLRPDDPHEHTLAVRAESLSYKLRAVAEILKQEKRRPTRKGAETIRLALDALDRATAAVEYDIDRVRLRKLQETLLPPHQPFCVCWAPAFLRIPPTGPTKAKPVRQTSLTLARGEAESFQLVIVPYWEPLKKIRVSVGDLFRRNGVEKIAAKQIRLWLVESVATSPTVGRPQLWPDPLGALRPFDLPATVSQALLVNVYATKDQRPGLYEGRIRIAPENARRTDIAVSVKVLPFTLPAAGPAVAFRPRNEYIRNRFAAPPPNAFASKWASFLRGFGLIPYRGFGPYDRADGWEEWISDYPGGWAEGQTAPPPCSAAAPTALAFRKAGWAAWESDRPRARSPRRIVNAWVSIDPATPPPGNNRTAPFIRTRWSPEKSPHPPGIVFVTPGGEPQPTLRLIALRDGIEDYRLLSLFARRYAKAKSARLGNWWDRRRWRKLLRINRLLVDPDRIAPETGTALLERRDEIARAILAIENLRLAETMGSE